MRKFPFFLLLSGMVMMAACRSYTPVNDTSTANVQSSEAAVAEVRQLFQQFVDDWNAADLDKVMALIADDFVQMQPDTVFAGKQAMEADWRQHLEQNTDAWSPNIKEIRAANNLVFVKAHFTEIATPKDGSEPRTIAGEGLSVFRRDENGSWKLVLDQWVDTSQDCM